MSQARLAAELTQFIDTANAPIFGVDIGGRVSEWNQQAVNITGFAKDEVMGRDLVAEFITDDYKDSVRGVLKDALQGNETANYEFPLYTKDGRRIEVLLNATTRRDIDGNIVGVLGVGQDITELRQKDAALRQAQKMEAIGQLTGGIAHDFNNLLMVIGGNLRFLQQDVPGLSADSSAMLNDALDAARDGAELTERLLAFSRTRILKPVVVGVEDMVSKFVRFLARTLGENVRLETAHQDRGACLTVDRVQLENALLNLALNSRDSMESSGTITIMTARYQQEDSDPLALGLPVGSYARLTVADTGKGIDAKVIPHVFEPFFTTKEVGRGSGLGLSMVYGFTQQSGGACRVDETGPTGTKISLFFPASDVAVSAVPPASVEVSSLEGRKRVLIAEDDDRVRRITVRDVNSLGYQVIEVEDAAAARRVLSARDDIDMLLSDVLMPGDMDGFQLAEWTRASHPTVKVLLVSGYTKGTGGESDAFPLLEKPYELKDLAKALEKCFDVGA